MKSISYTLLAAVAAAGLAMGADTATTDPVGYVSLGDTTSGQPAVKANTDVALTIPLHQGSVATATVGSVSGSVLTVNGTPGWTSNQWAASASVPYLIAVKSGSGEGIVGLITANTANTLTVTGVNGGNISAVGGGNIIIFKAWTLANLFSGSSLPAGVRILAYTGTAAGTNIAPDLQYVWNGTNWIQLAGGSGIADNTILYAGEAFTLRTGAAPINSLIISGVVPTFNHQAEITKLGAGAQDNRVGYFSPVDEVIGNAGLGFNPGDRLLAYDNTSAGINKAPAIQLVWNGTDWIGLAGVTGVQTNTFKLKAGNGYIYQRAAAAPAGAVNWAKEQSYIPSL